MVIAELRHRISWQVQILVDSDPAAGCAAPSRDPGSKLSLKVSFKTYADVKWRMPLPYLLPGLRSITAGFRSRAIDRSWERGLEPGGAVSWCGRRAVICSVGNSPGWWVR